jgi:hypothetical protein
MWRPKLAFADFVFYKGTPYHLVEAEESINNSGGIEQVPHNASLFEDALRKAGMTSYEETPVFGGIKYPDMKKKHHVGVLGK